MKKIRSILGVILSFVIIISASNIYATSVESFQKDGYQIKAQKILDDLKTDDYIFTDCFDVVDYQEYIDYGVIALFGIFVIVSLILWLKDGIDKKTDKIFKNYPPENMNSLEVGFAYKGKATKKDVTSLLIYLATKGYLKIEETTKNTKFSKYGFKIKKIKEYDGDNEYEREFFNGLFEVDEYATEFTLTASFYKVQNEILKLINSDDNKNKIMKEKSRRNKKIVNAFQIITAILMVLVFGVSLEKALIALVVLTTGLIAYEGVKVSIGEIAKGETIKIFFGSLGLLITCVYIWLLYWMIIAFVLPYFEELSYYKILTLEVGVVASILLAIFSKIVTSKTKEGKEIYTNIKGFKNFIKESRKSELEELIVKDSNYFYNILPYIYVLNLGDYKWLKKFYKIDMAFPDWYEPLKGFSVDKFEESIKRIFNKANKVMSSVPDKYSERLENDN